MKLYKSKLFRLGALAIAMSQMFSIPTITSFADEGQENVMANDMVEQTVNEMTEERIFTQPIENEIAAEDFIVTEEEITPAYELKPILEGNKYEAKEIISILRCESWCAYGD